jgi:opacity protein-like surface antigen
MKRLTVVAVLVAAALSLAVAAGAAKPPHPTTDTITFVGPGPGGATFSCTLSHITNPAFPGNATSGGRDNETCLISGNTTGYIAGTYSGAPIGVFPPIGSPVGWASDYPPLNNEVASYWTFDVMDNGDGTFTFTGHAIYAIIP